MKRMILKRTVFTLTALGLIAVGVGMGKESFSVNPEGRSPAASDPRSWKAGSLSIPLHVLEILPADEAKAIEDTNRVIGQYFQKAYLDVAPVKDESSAHHPSKIDVERTMRGRSVREEMQALIFEGLKGSS